jgi:hypothetical protein
LGGYRGRVGGGVAVGEIEEILEGLGKIKNTEKMEKPGRWYYLVM